MKDCEENRNFQLADAAHHLDSVISGLLKQQSGVEGTDYYKHLVDAFEGPFCDVSQC